MVEANLNKEELLKRVESYVQQQRFIEQLDFNQQPSVSFLAQGEYNLNFLVETDNKKVVLRLNTGSQMNLDNQIKYEYNALEYLEESGVTPQPLFLDDSQSELPLGMLVMNYLPGRSMSYQQDLNDAARVLAKVHNVKVPENHQLITEEQPLSGIWKECSELVPTYLNSSLGDYKVKKIIDKMVTELDDLRNCEGDIVNLLPLSIVNTEVNSGNFIINQSDDKAYLVDWEKPLVTSPLQDLSHFMVPTTTLWKTDYQLDQTDRHNFLAAYCAERNFSDAKLAEIKEAVEIFDKFSAMRGISWSAMAWVEYQQPDRMLKNQDTFETIDQYLTEEFLANLFPEFS
ncbi:MAG: aminoglycoside phosphotransferase family protein [Bacillota bacterium]